MFPDDARSKSGKPPETPGPADGPDSINSDLESLILSVESDLVAGSKAELPDGTQLPSDLVSTFRETVDCLELLYQSARAGQLNDLTARELHDLGGPRRAESPMFDRIGRFQIVRELGRGGYGLVFLAIDPVLGREVALKVPRPEVLVTEELRRRFVREAEAAGSLEHRNLVTVYEACEVGPLCYLATAYCAGPTLVHWRARCGKLVDARTAARFIAELADGVAHAHARGVLHRDIKPSNVLLEPNSDCCSESGETSDELLNYTPKLTDFGLAKLLERQDDETRTGTVLGTPAYMAPEQAAGRLADICAATDVYGLGVLLYELLVGHTPFRGENDPDTLRRLCSDEPTPPSRRCEVPADLEAIVLKCLEKSPSARYPSAADLAADLRRYLAGEPTLARPLHGAQRLQRWLHRRPLVASLLGTIGAALLSIVVLTGWYTARLGAALALSEQQRTETEAQHTEAERQRNAAKESQHRAEASQRESRRLLYAADIQLADEAYRRGNLQEAVERLRRYLPSGRATEADDLREFAWHYLWHRCRNPLLTLRGHSGSVFSVCYSPTGERVATGAADGAIRLWDRDTGVALRTLQGHEGDVNQISYSPDGKLLASAGADGAIKIWDAATGELTRLVLVGADEMFAVKFSSQGRLLAAGGRDGFVRIWQTTDWSLIGTLEAHSDFVESLDFAPDDTTLASAGDDSQLILWEIASMKPRRTLAGRCGAIYVVRFSPRGTRVATGGQNGEVVLWDAISGEELRRSQAHHARLTSLAFSPDGTRILTGGRDASARLWDVSSGQQLAVFDGHAERLWQVAYAPDAVDFVTASADGTAKLCKFSDHYETLPQYSIDRGQVTIDRIGHLHAVTRSGTDARGIAVYDEDQREEWRPSESAPPVMLITGLASTGLAAVATDVAGEVFFQPRGQPWKRELTGVSHLEIWPPAVSPDGQWLAIGWEHLRLFDMTHQNSPIDVNLPAAATWVQFSEDGSQLAATLIDGRVAVWNVNHCELPRLLAGAAVGRAARVSFSPDGRQLAVASEEGRVRIISSADGALVLDLTTHVVEPTSLVFSPDGKNLATAGGGCVYLSDIRTGQNLLVLDQLHQTAHSLAFGPSSDELVCHLREGEVVRWTAPSSTRVVRRAAATDVALRSPTNPSKQVRALPWGSPSRVASLLRAFQRFTEISDKRRQIIRPTFDDREDDQGLLVGTLTLPKCSTHPAQYTERTEADSFELLSRDADEYSRREMGGAGYPFLNDKNVTTLVSLEAASFDRQQLKASELGDIDSPRDRFREIHRWAKAHGYAGGFPNFVDSQNGGETLYGAILVKKGYGEEVFLPASTVWPAAERE